MNIAIFIVAALCGYLVSGLNPAIIMSKMIFHEDIREKGSKNPGFTNFKRVYGNLGWVVLLLDLSKAFVLEAIFGLCFAKIFADSTWINFAFGAAYTGIFAILGHAYPVWYKFKGGKAYVVCLSTLIMVSWKGGLVSAIMMIILLLTTKYMSLSTLVGLIAGVVVMPFVGVTFLPEVICICGVLFVIYRHKANIQRLMNGTESKFVLFGKKKAKTAEAESTEEVAKEETTTEETVTEETAPAAEEAAETEGDAK